jgi:NitT/TauT family transport system permease protein
MTGFQTLLSRLGAATALLAFASGLFGGSTDMAVVGGSLLLLLAGVRHFTGILPHVGIDLGAGLVGMAVLFLVLDSGMGADFWWLLVASWLFSWLAVERGMMSLTNSPVLSNTLLLAVPVFFGMWIIFVWQMLAVGLDIPMVLLPSPAQIAVRFMASTAVLWADFQQTFLKSALIGYLLGCGSAFILAIIIDRVPFLQRGLLPVGNFVSALPVIGIAPIMVMWFGFDWQSKAAVVVVMTFFPMLVNTVAGLQASQGDGARSAAHLCLILFSAVGEAAASDSGPLYLQCPEDQLDAGSYRCHRGRILRHPHCGSWLSHFHRSWTDES